MPDDPPPAPRTPPSPRDQAARRLSRGVRRGDRDAIAEFYTAWFDWCLAAARRLTMRDESTCLDAVQDAMLRVVRSMPAMDSHADVERWMTRVVHTSALDTLRSEARRRKREIVAASHGRGGSAHCASDPSEIAGLEEHIAWLGLELDLLEPETRRPLLLRFAFGRTLTQIGTDSGSTGAATHGRIRRALARLSARAGEGHP